MHESHIWKRECDIDERPYGYLYLNVNNKSHIYCTFDKPWVGLPQCVCFCLQEHHSPALPDHHPGEEIPQSPDVPGGPEESLRGSQSQVGGAAENLLFSLHVIFIRGAPLFIPVLNEWAVSLKVTGILVLWVMWRLSPHLNLSGQEAKLGFMPRHIFNEKVHTEV